ncbi:hypothetical protein [Bradyrhizobium sp. URHC0002]
MTDLVVDPAGRIRSLVFFSPNRAPNFPDVPTTEEATGHKWHKGVWRGFDMIYLDSAGFAEFMNEVSYNKRSPDEPTGRANARPTRSAIARV